MRILPESPCCISYKFVLLVTLAVVFYVGFTVHHIYDITSDRSAPTCAFTNRKGSDSSGTPPVTLDINYVEENLFSLNQKDPQLIQYARARHLTPPSKLDYNLDNEDFNFRGKFSGWVANFFGNKTGGLFIEAGAYSGEQKSHTLYLERSLGWTGVLVECNPKVLPALRTKHRKAWIADVCLSPTGKPGTLTFSNPMKHQLSGTLRKAWKIPGIDLKWERFDVETMPLYTILAALGWKEVDYFSLDIEGKELDVLKNFPFDLVTFKVIIVESYNKKHQQKELDKLIRSKGYVFVKRIRVDIIYVHEKYKNMIPAE